MNIRVGNLSRDIKEEDLHEAFQDFGEILSVTISISKNGRKEYVAFVEMPDEEQARKAIAYMDGVELQGRHITVMDMADSDETEEDYSEFEDDGEAVAHVKHTKRHNPDSDRR